MSPLWDALVDGKTFARKPSYGLRLFAADRQTLVGVSPIYNRRTKTVDSGPLLFEVIGEVERYLSPVDPTPFYQLERRLSLQVQTGALPRWRSFRRSAVEDSGDPCPDAGAISCGSLIRVAPLHNALCGVRQAFDGWAISGAGHWPGVLLQGVHLFRRCGADAASGICRASHMGGRSVWLTLL